MSAAVGPQAWVNPFWLLVYSLPVLNLPTCECPEPEEYDVVIATVISKS